MKQSKNVIHESKMRKIKLAVYTCKRKKRFVSQLSLLTKPGYAVQYLNKRIWNLTYGAGCF